MSTPSSTPPRSDAVDNPPQGAGLTFTSLLTRARAAAGGGTHGATVEDASVSSVGGNSFASTVDEDDGDTSGTAGEFVIQMFCDDVRLVYVCGDGVPGGFLSSQRGEDRSSQGRGSASLSRRLGLHRYFGAPMGSSELRVVYDGRQDEGGDGPRHVWARPPMMFSWIHMGHGLDTSMADRWSRAQWWHLLLRRWAFDQWLRAFNQQRRRRRRRNIQFWAGAEVMQQDDIIIRNQPTD